MKGIKLISDSSCDLPIDIIEKENISIVPLNIQFEDETYIDGVNIDKETFYKKMKETKTLPKTSSPSPDGFLNEFSCEEDEILILCLSSKLSSTYNNALIAKNMYQESKKSKTIEVIDTLNGSMGIGLLILKAIELIKDNKDMKYIVDFIEKEKYKIFNYVLLDNIENAVKAGRISAIKGAVAQVLNLKIIVSVEDGLVKIVDKARGDKKSFAKIISLIEESKVNTKERNLAICYADSRERAMILKSIITENFQFKDIIVSQIGSTIGTYAASGAVLVTF